MANSCIEIENEYVCISDDKGEIVYWHHEEWEEDPSIVPSILNAIKIYYTQGVNSLRAMFPAPR